MGWGDGVREVWGRHREDTGKTQGRHREGQVWVQGRFGVEGGGRGINKAPAGVAGAIR